MGNNLAQITGEVKSLSSLLKYIHMQTAQASLELGYKSWSVISTAFAAFIKQKLATRFFLFVYNQNVKENFFK